MDVSNCDVIILSYLYSILPCWDFPIGSSHERRSWRKSRKLLTLLICEDAKIQVSSLYMKLFIVLLSMPIAWVSPTTLNVPCGCLPVYRWLVCIDAWSQPVSALSRLVMIILSLPFLIIKLLILFMLQSMYLLQLAILLIPVQSGFINVFINIRWQFC